MTNHNCCDPSNDCQIYPDNTRRRQPRLGEYNAALDIPDTDDPYSKDNEYCSTGGVE